MNIVLTGSLGNISLPLTKMLVGQGHQVTLISSDPEKQKAIETLGAKPAIGSIEDADFLLRTFSEADAVYTMTPFKMTEPDQAGYFKRVNDNYARAIQGAGIKRVVNLTGWSAHLFKGGNLESLLEAQLPPDVALTQLRPGSFYSNFYSYTNMIKTQGMIAANYGGEDIVVFVAPIDIASAIAEEIVTPQTGKKIRYAASDELTCNQAAHILGEAIGKPDLQWIILTEEQMRQGLAATGMPAQLVDMLVEMQALMHSGKPYEDYCRNKPVLGPTKLTTFAKEFAAHYFKD